MSQLDEPSHPGSYVPISLLLTLPTLFYGLMNCDTSESQILRTQFPSSGRLAICHNPQP